MPHNRLIRPLVAILVISVGVAAWGVLVGRFGLPGLLAGLAGAYVLTWVVSARLKARRCTERDSLRADIAALQDRLER